MPKEHWAPEGAWTLVHDDEAWHWEWQYRQIWKLSATFEPSSGQWHCVARAEGFMDGFKEDRIEGTQDKPWPAMQRCYEMADAHR